MRHIPFACFATPATLSALLLFAACGEDRSNAQDGVQQRVTLEPFASCDDLERYIEDTAVQEMNLQIEQIKQGPIGLIEDGPSAAGAPTAAAPKAGGSAGAAPVASTTTNTQVKGVDEADFVKNDGTRIFVLSGQTLYATHSWPPEQLALAGSLPIEGAPSEMFLDEHDRVTVFSNVYVPYDGTVGGPPAAGGAEPAIGAPCAADSLYCGYFSSDTMKVTVIDVSNLAALRVIDEYYLPGQYVSARRVGTSMRIVLRDDVRWPIGVKFYPEGTIDWNDRIAYGAALDALKPQNEAVIRGQSLSHWLPPVRHKLQNGQSVEVPYRCQDFYRQNAPARLGLATVATINLDHLDQPPGRSSILAEVGTIYASPTSLYIASPHWWWWPSQGQSDYTYLHKFDIMNPDVAAYVASGGVDGHIVDQFSMDEYRGYLRVASTIATQVSPTPQPGGTAPLLWQQPQTTNRVSVLAEQAGALAVVGRTEDLAPGEQIYSSRFLGDRGFVVTFRHIDPLFTIDLANPLAPRVVGTLKSPGVSTYIHPLDDNHLLTIGIYTGAPSPGGFTEPSALKLSIFDVTDFAHPRESFTQTVGTSYSWSEATSEHKAFNYFAERKLLAIPFYDYSQVATTGDYWGGFTSELRVFDIDALTGFRVRGALSMKDVYQAGGYYNWVYYYSPWVRRSVMATDLNGQDFVYAVSDAGVRVSNGTSLAAPMSTVRFPVAQPSPQQ